MFPFDFQAMGGFDLFVTGRSHFLLSKRSLEFNNAMITLTSALWSARIVELASGKCIVIKVEYGPQSHFKIFLNKSDGKKQQQK